MAFCNIPLRRSTSGLLLPHELHQHSQNQQIPCALCGRLNCNLKTHKAYFARVRSQGFRKHDVSGLLSTSFTSSYAFNPLTVAVDYICGQLQLDFDPRELGAHRSLAFSLNKLISYDIGRNTPFTDPAGHVMGEVAAEWLVASTVDELACTSTLNLWLIIEWTNTKKVALKHFSSKLTTIFLELLRKRVESKDTATTGTIFAASNHLATSLIFFKQTIAQCEVMMNGLEALVNSRGGFERLTDDNHPGLFQSLLWTDILFSCFTGGRPRFRVRSPPPMPHSLIPERTTASHLPPLYQRCCGPDLLDTAKCLRLFLLFRHGLETRELSKAEYQYIVASERYVHVQLLDQSARYHETGTMAECIVLAMGLVRMSILCVWEQHVMARRMQTQRLERALRRVNDKTWLESDTANALVWVCWIMLAQSEIKYSKNAVLRSMIVGLKHVLGDDPTEWPEGWEAGFACNFQPLLWHADYGRYIPAVSKLIIEAIERGP